MIRGLMKTLWFLANRDRIPRLPRGMLATRYEGIASHEGRVLARLGARDPRGVAIAMKRAGVDTVEALVQKLDHFSPERRFKQRFSTMMGRALNATDYHPHREAVLRDARAARKKPAAAEIDARLKSVTKAFK